MRLTGRPMEVYQYLEPLYNDYRRVRLRTEEGHFELTSVDQIVDEMLRNEYLFDIALPRVPNRCSPLPFFHPLGTSYDLRKAEHLRSHPLTLLTTAKTSWMGKTGINCKDQNFNIYTHVQNYLHHELLIYRA